MTKDGCPRVTKDGCPRVTKGEPRGGRMKGGEDGEGRVHGACDGASGALRMTNREWGEDGGHRVLGG